MATSRHHNPGANPPPRRRSWLLAMLRGARCRCPSCGQAHLYAHGLSVVDRCPSCGAELYHHRADRMGPLFAAFLALNLVIVVSLILDQWANLQEGSVLFVALAVGISSFWLLLPAAKGMIVGLQWAWRLHGFQYAAMCRPRQPAAPRLDEAISPPPAPKQGRAASLSGRLHA